jgi:hypothetical protein
MAETQYKFQTNSTEVQKNTVSLSQMEEVPDKQESL